MNEAYLSRIDLASYCIATAALLGVLWLGLLPMLLSGLLIYHLVVSGSEHLGKLGIPRRTGRLLLVLFIASIVIAGLVLSGFMLAVRVSEGPESLVALFQKMADGVDSARLFLPLWVQSYLPTSLDEWQTYAANWLREHAQYFSMIGRDTGMFLLHIFLGMIIGAMIALTPPNPSPRISLAHALVERIEFFGEAFRRIVFSQVRISALNTALTGIFLVLVMPALGYDLPLLKTMILVTFVVGLLPIIGNIISNTVIVLICISISAGAAVMALVFLVVIHKLEYFVNAHIIGSRIRAKSWEILLALVVMESAFGITGLVAAPVYYAYIKDELSSRKLI